MSWTLIKEKYIFWYYIISRIMVNEVTFFLKARILNILMNGEICRNTCDIPRSETTIQIWIVKRSVVLIMVISSRLKLNWMWRMLYGLVFIRREMDVLRQSCQKTPSRFKLLNYLLLHLVFCLLVLTIGPKVYVKVESPHRTITIL